jgi:hypothetical protein
MCRNYEEYKSKPCWSQIRTFPEICPRTFFEKWSCYGLKTASNGKLPNYKVVGNFARNVLGIKFN